MTKPALLPWCALLTVALAGVSAPSHARNTKLLFPIDEVTRLHSTQQIVGTDMGFHFGATLPENIGREAEAIGDAWAQGVANPMQPGPMGRYGIRTDQQTCREAFRNALSDLSQQARSRGGNAIVGIISYYDRVEMNSPSAYECHAGMTRAVVELRGRITKLDQAVVASLQTRAKAGTFGKTRAVDATPSSQPGIEKTISDMSLLPNASDRMKERYQVFLTRPLPRAFAISESGGWWMAWGRSPKDPDAPADPADRAIQGCEKNTQSRCMLYAVDNNVAYQTSAK